MTTTYDISTNVGKVRLKIGDTNTSDAVFTDEEIGIFLTNNDDSINLAAAEALEAWAAKYGASADTEKIGDYSYSQKIIEKMLTMAKNLREADASGPVLDIASMDLATVPETDASEESE